MSRYLVLLPAPEAEWADLPPEEREKGHRSHGTFQEDLRAACRRFAGGGEHIELCRMAE